MADLTIPPAGLGAPAPAPSGVPIVSPGQVPGFVVPPMQGPGNVSTAPAAPPVAPPANADAATMQAMMAALIAAQGQATPPNATNTAPTPAWVPQNMNTFDVSELGDDPILSSMAGLLQAVGKDVDLNRVLGNALAHGDANLIDVQYLAEKGGANAQYLAQIAKGIVQAVSAKGDALLSEVHTMAGGEAAWGQATAVFNASAPAALKTAVKTMLDSRNPTQVRAGAMLVSEFGRASGRIPQRGAPLLNGASTGLGAASGLSKAGFQAELFKLDQSAPGYREARDALFSRRSLGKNAGL